MKTKILLTIFAIGFMVNAFGQKATMVLAFTAVNNGQYVPLDSIFIKNLTHIGDTTLYAPDTVLMLDYVTSINDNDAIGQNSLTVSQNYPNPFKGKTEFDLYLPEKENIKITGRDILGRELVLYQSILNRGNHSFAFYAGNESYYLLTVTGNQKSQTIKMLNAGSNTTNGGNCKLLYNANKGNVSGFKSQKAINVFVFNLGDSLEFTGYANTVEGIFGSAKVNHKPNADSVYVFDILKGLRCPGSPIITDIDGNVYTSAQIGSQCWMAENLKTTTYRNGTSIPNVSDNFEWQILTTGAYAWYSNDISWKDPYGALYNWYASDNTNGLCPAGWHIPTNEEWTVLTDFIGGTASPYGNKLKSCRQINSPLGGDCNTIDHPRWNYHPSNYGTDDYGFSGLPGGYRFVSGGFNDLWSYGGWWSSTEYNTDLAWDRFLIYNSGYAVLDNNYKKGGFSVRCLKD